MSRRPSLTYSINYPASLLPAPRRTYVPLLGLADLHVLFFHGHGQFSDLLYDQIVETCTLDALKHNASITLPGCNTLLDQLDAEVGGCSNFGIVLNSFLRISQLYSTTHAPYAMLYVVPMLIWCWLVLGDPDAVTNSGLQVLRVQSL